MANTKYETQGVLQNPLNGYRSYSYHFALVIADSTSVFPALDSAEGGDFMQKYTRQDTSKEARYRQTQSAGGGKYIVLLNDAMDAHFHIETLTFSNIIHATSDAVRGGAAATSQTTDGTMTVFEPLSADLMEALLLASDSLGIDLAQTVFGLKIFFVGHGDHDHLDQSFNFYPIPILPFQISDMGINFTDKGTRYTIEMAPTMGGVGNQAKVNSPKGLNFKSEKTLPKAIAALNKALDALPSKDDENKVVIKYEVVLDSEYDDKYVLDAVNAQHYSDIVNGDTIQFNAKTSMSVPQIIEMITNCSSRVLDDIKGNNSSGSPKTLYRPKIYSRTDITKDSYKIIYFVMRSRETLVEKTDIENKKQQEAEGVKKLVDAAKANNSYLEYNYTYTGLNIDVLKFDVTIPFAIGVSMLYRSNNTNHPMSQKQATTEQKPTQTDSEPSNKGGKSPQAPGGASRQGSTTSNAGKLQSIRQALEQYATYSNTEGNLLIRGNPVLLNGILDQAMTVTSVPKGEVIEKLKQPKPGDNFSGWTARQPIVQVNIRVPRSKDIFVSDDAAAEGTENVFSQKFWHQGTFMLLSVKNMFDRGSFTQQLELILPPTAATLPQIKDQETSQPESAKTGAGPKSPSSTSTKGADGSKAAPEASPSKKDSKKVGKKVVTNVNGVDVITDSPAMEAAKKEPKFLDSLGSFEGGPKQYQAVNGSFLGRYQMGPQALTEAGYMRKVSASTPGAVQHQGEYYMWNDPPGSRTGYLNSPEIQDDAVQKYHKVLWNRMPADLRQKALDGNTEINGVRLTPSGLIAASHLVGEGSVKNLLKNHPNGDTVLVDGNKTPAVKYMEIMGNKPIDFIPQIANHPTKGVTPGGVGKVDLTDASHVRGPGIKTT